MSNGGMRFTVLVFILTTLLIASPAISEQEDFCPSGANPNAAVIFCDNFDDGNPVLDKWNAYNDTSFLPIAGVGRDGSTAMRGIFSEGQQSVGTISIAMGGIPTHYKPGGGGEEWQNIISPDSKFDELYVRQYLRLKTGWSGIPRKFSRFRILSDIKPGDTPHPTAYQGHFWQQTATGNPTFPGGLFFNSTRGVIDGIVVDTGNNCSATCPITWLPRVRGPTIVFPTPLVGESGWLCIEAHVKLNTPGQSDGIEEFWFNELEDARNDTQDMRGTYTQYGMNQIVFDNFWNGGSPQENTLYRDNIVISTKRIGCITLGTVLPPTESEGINFGSGINLTKILNPLFPWRNSLFAVNSPRGISL